MSGILPDSGPRTQSALQYLKEVRRGLLLEELADLSTRMLYEFYSTQMIEDPGSIHATYLMDGASKPPDKSTINGHQHDGEDIHMQSSPYMSSSMGHEEDQEEAVTSRRIILANEDDLEGKMGVQFMKSFYFAAFRLSTAEKRVSCEGKIQSNTFHSYLQLGPKQGAGKPMKLYSRFRTVPIVIEPPNSVRLQRSNIRGIRE